MGRKAAIAGPKPAVGDDFHDLLARAGLLEEETAQTVKRVIARRFRDVMKAKRITKSEMAKRMRTSRSALDRLLDEDDAGLTIETLSRAARALGYRLRFELV